MRFLRISANSFKSVTLYSIVAFLQVQLDCVDSCILHIWCYPHILYGHVSFVGLLWLRGACARNTPSHARGVYLSAVGMLSTVSFAYVTWIRVGA